MNLTDIAKKAEHSSFYRWLLSRALNTVVPFNGPHRFKILDIGKKHIKMCLPYKKRNLNHLKGIHACALATLAEVTSGFILISILNPKKYRIILGRLEMDYHYQAKTDVHAFFELDEVWLQNDVIGALKADGKVAIAPQIKIFDIDNNHIATGIAHWQIKEWSAVKTKV